MCGRSYVMHVYVFVFTWGEVVCQHPVNILCWLDFSRSVAHESQAYLECLEKTCPCYARQLHCRYPKYFLSSIKKYPNFCSYIVVSLN